jgi:hypothetical protein
MKLVRLQKVFDPQLPRLSLSILDYGDSLR